MELKGINSDIVNKISDIKQEPSWMREKRLSALKTFEKFSLPSWGPDLSKINFNEIATYILGMKKTKASSWEEVTDDIKKVYDDLGIIKEEQKALAGLGAQYQSEVIYNRIKKSLADKGVIFDDLNTAVKKYPKLIKKYFMTSCVPASDNMFAALHGALWSGGSFVYVPKNTKIELPLQAYFYMGTGGMGQFEHTLIIAEEGSDIHYIEGCSAPQFTKLSIHSGAVEIFVGKGAKVRYTTIQNWAKNVYNLNTKRAIVDEQGIMEWVSGSIGSAVTMLYPCTILKGKNSKANHLSITIASSGQDIDIGSKIYHLAEGTTSIIKAKSISMNSGKTNYRGLVKISKNAKNSVSSVECDALIVDDKSKSSTHPSMIVNNNSSIKSHEAKVGRISEKELFYLMSRGISEEEAKEMIVNGFIEPVLKSIPFEYAIEFNKFLSMELKSNQG